MLLPVYKITPNQIREGDDLVELRYPLCTTPGDTGAHDQFIRRVSAGVTSLRHLHQENMVARKNPQSVIVGMAPS
jgi:hypothetical protein